MRGRWGEGGGDALSQGRSGVDGGKLWLMVIGAMGSVFVVGHWSLAGVCFGLTVLGFEFSGLSPFGRVD